MAVSVETRSRFGFMRSIPVMDRYQAGRMEELEKAYTWENQVRRIALERGGERLTIPHRYLHGTKNIHEYQETLLKLVDRDLNEGKINLLKQRPVVVCALFLDNIHGDTECQLAIVAGHELARRAPKHQILEVPTVVLSVEQLADVYRTLGQTVDTDTLASNLKADVRNTLSSFCYHYPIQKLEMKPISVPKARTIGDLKSRFQSF